MMQRSIAKALCRFLSLLIILTGFVGCQKSVPQQTSKKNEPSNPDTPDSETLIDLSSYNYRIIDWYEYKTAEEIVNAATNVFAGKVVDISFEVFNIKTGQIDRSSEADKANRLLYTLYIIDVQENYKGSSASPITVKMVGGIDFRLEEQEELCREAGVVRPIISGGTTELTIGESYIFCTHRFQPYDAIINMKQFAFPVDSNEAEEIRHVCSGLN